MQSKIDYIFGIRATVEAINAGKEIEKVLIKKGLEGELISELFSLIKKRNIPYQMVPIEKINRVSRKNHQGVITYISPVVYHNIENLLPTIYEKGEIPFVLILDKVSDVRNFGAICRTAECAGVHAIVIPARGAAQINADAVKTSAGALHTIPVCREMNLKRTIDFLSDSGLKIIATTEKAETEYFNSDMNLPVAIIMGSEDLGVSFEYLKIADEKVKVPIHGEIESLNVSVAAGVMMYEVVRQRNIS